MKYKWKDKVMIKSKKELECISEVTDDMLKNGGAIMTIACLVEDADGYIMKEDGDFHFLWSDEMIEGLVEEKTNDCEKCGLTRNSIRCLFMDNCPHNKQKNIIEIPKDYVIKDENGNVINATKIVLEKKKKAYPKTYEECCVLLGAVKDRHYFFTKKDKDDYPNEVRILNILDDLRRLLICRDAYWKIAGEEMGLGKPWEPDYDSGVNKYGIICMNGVVQESNPTTNWERHLNKILDFPTAEMRDAFYENFKELIEQCKELL